MWSNYQQQLAIVREIGACCWEGSVLGNLANVVWQRGDIHGAARSAAEPIRPTRLISSV
jgi:hypothetical protein